MKRKSLAMLMALTLAAGTLTACGGSAATAPAESAQTGTTAGTEAGSENGDGQAAEEGTAAAAGEVQLPLTEEPVTLKAWMAIDATTANNITTYARHLRHRKRKNVQEYILNIPILPQLPHRNSSTFWWQAATFLILCGITPTVPNIQAVWMRSLMTGFSWI